MIKEGISKSKDLLKEIKIIKKSVIKISSLIKRFRKSVPKIIG